jgi:hypothetical protein
VTHPILRELNGLDERSNGQVKEAVSLLEHVVAMKRLKLAEMHPPRLVSK